jgi:hypothetical protein
MTDLPEKIKQNLVSIPDNLINLPVSKLMPYIDRNKLKLTNKQLKFAYFYVLSNGNACKAVELAGYGKNKNKDYFCSMGSILIKNKKIQEAIVEITENEIQIDKNILKFNLFKKLQLINDLDILDYLNEDGTVKRKLSDIPKAIRQCIKKTEVKFYGKDADVRVLTIEVLGKEFAINTLMKYIGMIKDENNTNINIMTNEVKMNLLNMLNGEK